MPDILLLLLSVADSLPNLEDIAAARGQSLGEKYAVFVIECLTSSKSETRSAASSLLETSVENGVVSSESIKKATGRLKPALQRSVGSLTAKFVNNAPGPLQTETESNHKRTTTLAERDQTVSHGRGQRLASKAQLSTPNTGTPRRRKEERAISTRPSTPPKHPLIPSSGKPLVGSSRSIIWPDYPEEPHGSVLENLKRFWAPFLPPATVSALFPSSGIKKQDDAKSGIEMLTRALSVDRSSGSTAVGEQLDLILKWLTFSLCSKESTTGLQDILLLLKDVLAYLLEIHRQLSDSESLETIPFLLDKVSSAKVRYTNSNARIVLDLGTLIVNLLCFRDDSGTLTWRLIL